MSKQVTLHSGEPADLSYGRLPDSLMGFHYNRRFIVPPMHAFLLAASLFLSALLYFDFQIPAKFMLGLAVAAPVLVAYKMLFFAHFHLHQGMWRFVTIGDCLKIFYAVLLGNLLGQFTLLYVGGVFSPFPRSLFIIDIGVSFLVVAGLRGSLRLFREFLASRKESEEIEPVLVFGANHSGQLVARELLAHPEIGLRPCGFVDDKNYFVGSTIHGLPVLGTSRDLPHIFGQKSYKALIVAVNTGEAKLNQLRHCCRAAQVELRCIPLMNYLLNGRMPIHFSTSHIKHQDLLGREMVQVENDGFKEHYRDKVCLVTGAGGSIGSEICRQLMRLGPQRLILVDNSENNLFHIDLELREYKQGPTHIPYVADIRDERRMREIFEQHRPQVVLHAAAYKHVPLMELHTGEAFQNNVLATRTLCRLCHEQKVEQFVLISSDKAVNPTSIMGFTKRMAELIVLEEARRPSATIFSAVRFGNVLNSAGSVVPIFKKQIADGGPITITHPEMRRYFMTIPEAVELVLCSAEIAQGGDVLVLEMGKQLKILELAKRMVRLAGLEEDSIPIKFTGLRPGEKLYEELASEDEHVLSTVHSKIRCIKPNGGQRQDVEKMIANLTAVLGGGEEVFSQQIREEMRRLNIRDVSRAPQPKSQSAARERQVSA